MIQEVATHRVFHQPPTPLRAVRRPEASSRTRRRAGRSRAGFSLIELMLVLVVMGLVAGMTLPKLNLNGSRADGAAQQIRGALMIAQRTAITRQYDVLVSIDTARGTLRIVEDSNDTGKLDAREVQHWRPIERAEGNAFAIPPKGYSAPSVTAPVVGSGIRSLDGLPTITFHRDGSASSDAEIYLVNASRGKPAFRCVTVTRSTGRAEAYRLSGSGSGATWIVSR